MADGSTGETLRSPEGGAKSERSMHEAVETALESGELDKANEQVEKDAADAVVEIKDYMKIGEDADDPTLTEDIRKRAAAVEAEILAAANSTKADIERTAKGEAAPAASPEAEIAELKKTNVTEATGETASVAKTEIVLAPPVEVPSAEAPPAVEGKEAPVNELINRFDAIVEEYKGANKTASKLLQKKMLKLMVDANPDTYPNDVRVAEIRSMIGRLKMAFDGDQRAWSTPQGVSFEQDFENLKKSFGKAGAAETAEAASAPTVAEEPIPEPEVHAGKQPPVPSEEPVSAEAPVAEPKFVDVDALNKNAEAAFQVGNQEDFGKLVDELDAGAVGNAALIAKEIDRMERLQPGERGPGHTAEIEKLRLDAHRLEKMAEWRRAQRELMGLRQELVLTTAELDRATRELEQRAGAQESNILSKNAEEGRVLAVPEEDPKIALQKKIEELTAKRDGLLKSIAGAETKVAGLAEELEKLKALQARASNEAEGQKKKAAKKTTEAGGSDLDESGNPMAPAQRPEKVPQSAKKESSGPGTDARIKQVFGYMHEPGDAAIDALDWLDKKLSEKPKEKE